MLRGQLPPGPRPSRHLTGFLTVSLGLILAQAVEVAPAQAQIPEDRIHVSLSLGGYVMVGIGITHWIEEHHSLEATLFPLGFPWEGFPAETGRRLGCPYEVAGPAQPNGPLRMSGRSVSRGRDAVGPQCVM